VQEFSYQSCSEQAAAYLREALVREKWGGSVPGIHRLSDELGVDHKTVMAALYLLEQEGILVPQGPGKRRKIVRTREDVRPLKIGHLLYEAMDVQVDYFVDLHHRLAEAGHLPFYTERTQTELNFELSRIRPMVEQADADAWIVSAGSQEVLTWFAQQAVPALALFGRMKGLPLAGAGTDQGPALVAAVNRLTELGHRRIVMLTRTERRLPEPGPVERVFLDELEARGIQTGNYNLPDWEDSPEGFQAILESLFQVTPPTALIVSEAFLLVATQQFLLHRGIRVPEDVSLICIDPDPTFAWCQPAIAHIAWDSRPVVRRIVRWAANVSKGREDLRKTQTRAEFVDGGTVGPAKK